MQVETHGSWWSELAATAEFALIILRPDGIIEHVNPSLAARIDQPPSALVGANLLERLVVDTHREQARVFFLGEPSVASSARVVIPLRTSNGADAYIRWTRIGCGGGLLAASGIDISLEVRQEAEIRQAEAMVFSYLQASSEAVVIADAQGAVVLFSDGAEKVFRCKRESIAGKPISELMPERFRAAHATLVGAFIRSGASSRKMAERTEFRALRYTGEEFAAEASIARLSTRTGDLFTVILHDLSERKAYEIALESAKTRAEAANEAKTAFLATMSHEIRTPMNAVLGMLSVLSMEDLKASQQEMVEVAIEAGQGLMDILNDILDYSRIGAGELQLEFTEFDIRSVLRKIQTLHGFKANAAGIVLSVEIDPAAPAVLLGDPGRLQQILHNLVSNAIKFTRKGSVTVDAHVVRGAGEAATLVLDVVDTGTGISKDKLDVIFDRFTQADASITRKFGGSGLGLSIVKGIVVAMGGEITVQSELGKGSHFSVRIPVQAPDRAVRQSKAPALHGRPASPMRPIRVLVAEDNVLSADTLKLLLERERVSVSIARNGEEALRQFAPGHFDLVFLDTRMPVLDADAAVQALRKLEDVSGLKKAIVVATAAELDAKRRALLEQAGFDHALTKPPAPAEIDRLVNLARLHLSGSSA